MRILFNCESYSPTIVMSQNTFLGGPPPGCVNQYLPLAASLKLVFISRQDIAGILFDEPSWAANRGIMCLLAGNIGLCNIDRLTQFPTFSHTNFCEYLPNVNVCYSGDALHDN